MGNAKELQIQSLLNGKGKAGPELTHSLRELGGGKMADGLVELWKAGQHNGAVKGATITTLLFTAAIGGYVLIKNAIEDREMKKVLSEIQDEHQVLTEATQCTTQGKSNFDEEQEISLTDN